MKNPIIKRTTAALLMASSLMLGGSQLIFAAELKAHYGGILRLSDTFEGTGIGYPPKMTKTVFALREVCAAIETLLRIDKSGRPMPWLAVSFKEDAKAKSIILTIRKGVKFHDGTDLDADAIKWNLDQHAAAKTAGTENMVSVETVDAYTVRINLSSWDNTFTSNLAQHLGLVVSPTAYKKNGEEWAAKNPVGTGPFQFVSSQKEVRTSFRKFTGYWQKGKPYLDGVDFMPISDYQTREMSLRKGEVDLAVRIQVKGVAGLEKDGFVITRTKPGSGAVSLVPDSANPNSPFSNVKVRQALAHAVDINAIVKTVLLGETEAANQQIYKGNWAYNSTIIGYPYNPSSAKKLLTEAGYPNGFKTKLSYLMGGEFDMVFTAVQGYLKAVGIDAELDPMQMGRHTQTTWQGGKWEGLIMTMPSGNPDVLALLGPFYGGVGKSLAQMIVPEDYALTIRDAISAPDFKNKQKLTCEAMKLMIDKYALMCPVYFMPDFAAAKKNIKNHGVYEIAQTGLWRPEDAWIEK